MQQEFDTPTGYALVPTSKQTGEHSPVDTAAWSPWTDAIAATERCTTTLTRVLQDFWGVPVDVQLLGISNAMQYYWRLDDFHVSQFELGLREADGATLATDSGNVLLRLSDSACSILLNTVLGTSEQEHPFTFRQISPLEASIINEFSKDVLSTMRKVLIERPPPGSPATPVVHVVWLVQLANQSEPLSEIRPGLKPAAPSLSTGDKVGKIILTLPAVALKVPNSPPKLAQSVPDSFFYHVQTTARIALGSTRMQLSDLHNLERDDVVVLEDSDPEFMALLSPDTGEALPFSALIPQRSRISLPEPQSDMQEFDVMDTPDARQTLWDNLMIDVSAEFTAVKLPLKQLRQMTEGLVVEMGDLIHNQVSLQVEGKTLAWGELVIVGDKFGVRINKLEAEDDTDADADETGAPRLQGGLAGESTGSGEPAADGAPDEADNFLNEDFDGAFEEEEEW